MASRQGYRAGTNENGDADAGKAGKIRICPNCLSPTYFTQDGWHAPEAPPGRDVQHVPTDVRALYKEARKAAGVGAHTASVMACRKILMNVAVEKGAMTGRNFVTYIEHLAERGYVPPDGKAWVDYIRTRGNEANHEIALMSDRDSTALIGFVEMLLRFIYELPALVPAIPKATP